MTRGKNLPWDLISRKEGEAVWRRSGEAACRDFWWGWTDTGSAALLLMTSEDHAEIVRRQAPRMSGLSVDLVEIDEGRRQGLLVELKTLQDMDIFHRLCLGLIEEAERMESEAQAVNLILIHIERWREFLSRARRQKLSMEEVRGLFAEIAFIEYLHSSEGVGLKTVVSGWGGPLGAAKDFSLRNRQIEVKATSSAGMNSIHISSEWQLDQDGVPLFLAVFDLGEDDTGAGTSLNARINRLRDMLDEETRRLFEERLSEIGYADLEEYDVPEFIVRRTSLFAVSDNFPCIRASELPRGVHSVKYSVNLDMAADFEVATILTGDDR